MMNHPLIGDLTDKTMEELGEIISNLSKKQMFAARSGNQAMINQLQMALASYRAEYQNKQAQLLEKSGTGASGKIDIT